MGKRKKNLLAALLLASTVFLSGCGNIVFITNKTGKPLLTCGDTMATREDLKVYMLTLQKQYENLFGADMWSQDTDGSMEENLRDNALSMLTHVTVLDEMAGDQGVALTDEETALADEASQTYYESLNAKEKSYLGLNENRCDALYENLALAGKTYDAILAAANIEVSDDEARTVTCQYICILSADDAMTRATSIRQEIADGIENLTGVTFLEYIQEYNEDTSYEMQISRSDSETALADAAFSLDVNEISDPVQTEDGNVYILKCISLSDTASMEEKKAELEKQKKEEAFATAYNDYLETIQCGVDEETAAEVTIVTDEDITADSFLTIYRQYLSFGEDLTEAADVTGAETEESTAAGTEAAETEAAEAQSSETEG